MAKTVYVYDAVDNKIEESYVGVHDEPVLNKVEKAARIIYERDGAGTLIATRRFDANGKLLSVEKASP